MNSTPGTAKWIRFERAWSNCDHNAAKSSEPRRICWGCAVAASRRSRNWPWRDYSMRNCLTVWETHEHGFVVSPFVWWSSLSVSEVRVLSRSRRFLSGYLETSETPSVVMSRNDANLWSIVVFSFAEHAAAPRRVHDSHTLLQDCEFDVLSLSLQSDCDSVPDLDFTPRSFCSFRVRFEGYRTRFDESVALSTSLLLSFESWRMCLRRSLNVCLVFFCDVVEVGKVRIAHLGAALCSSELGIGLRVGLCGSSGCCSGEMNCELMGWRFRMNCDWRPVEECEAGRDGAACLQSVGISRFALILLLLLLISGGKFLAGTEYVWYNDRRYSEVVTHVRPNPVSRTGRWSFFFHS